MSNESSTESAPRSGWVGRLSTALAVVLFVYPLSTGPAVLACEACFGSYFSGHPAWRVLEVVYAPLIWLSESVDFVADFFDWYVGDCWRTGL